MAASPSMVPPRTASNPALPPRPFPAAPLPPPLQPSPTASSPPTCTVMPSDASMTATTTSARRTALSARSTLRPSELSALSATCAHAVGSGRAQWACAAGARSGHVQLWTTGCECWQGGGWPAPRVHAAAPAARTLLRLRMPAVSMSLSLVPSGRVSSVSMASRVVPLMSHTITRSSPHSAFSRLLLPAGGAGAREGWRRVVCTVPAQPCGGPASA